MSALDVAAKLVRQFEGCKLTAYLDSGGVLTIGWGHTGPDVKPGLVWTQTQADEALEADLRHAADGVVWLVKPPLSDRQLGALYSFAFNLGAAALKGTLLISAVNDGRWADAVHQWTRWDHDNGREVKGLLHRRLIEAATYLEGTP